MLDKVVREFASTEDMIRQGEFVIQSELTKLFFFNKIINSYLYFQLQFFLSTQLIIVSAKRNSTLVYRSMFPSLPVID